MRARGWRWPPGPWCCMGRTGRERPISWRRISLLTPGKGLRGATAAEMGRREPGEATGRAPGPSWSSWTTRRGWAPASRRQARRGVSSASTAKRPSPGGCWTYLRPVWATPEQDRLFSDARAERLKFFDRLVFAADPDHAASVSAYDKALRERLRLLNDAADGREAHPVWLDALEVRAGDRRGAGPPSPASRPCIPCKPPSTGAATVPLPPGGPGLGRSR